MHCTCFREIEIITFLILLEKFNLVKLLFSPEVYSAGKKKAALLQPG